MFTRMISSIVIVAILFYVLVTGGVPFYLAITVISIMALKEFYSVFKESKINPINWIGYFLATYLTVSLYFDGNVSGVGSIIFIMAMIVSVGMIKNKYNVLDISITLFGVLYIPYFLNYLIYIMKDYDYIVWLPFVIGWMSDTFAYFTGVFFGKHKLIPAVSPKKTVEGSIGGILASVISCVIFGYIYELNPMHMVIIGMIGSVVSQVGDLFASSIKRYLGVKDYGNVIPGHGGILDRFDSIIFTAPLVYYYVSYFIL